MKTKQSCQIETGGEIKVRDRWLKKENKNKCENFFYGTKWWRKERLLKFKEIVLQLQN